MTLEQVNQILEVCFKRAHRSYAVWQRVRTAPTANDIMKMLKDTDYVSNLEWKQKSQMADCKYWEDRIRDNTYKNHPFNKVNKFYNLEQQK